MTMWYAQVGEALSQATMIPAYLWDLAGLLSFDVIHALASAVKLPPNQVRRSPRLIADDVALLTAAAKIFAEDPFIQKMKQKAASAEQP